MLHTCSMTTLCFAYERTLIRPENVQSILHECHVSLNSLNELGKRDKMRGLPSILSLFCNEFNKFNNTRARMLDSIYHMLTQPGTLFILHINVKMPTIVRIFTFNSRITSAYESLQARKYHFSAYKCLLAVENSYQVELNMKTIYNLGARLVYFLA